MTAKISIDINEFNYPLPDSRIAGHPLQQRDMCKLLHLNSEGKIAEHIFTDLPSLLPNDAMLVCNNTRVINARLRFRKGEDRDGALIEIFCLEPHAPSDYALALSGSEPSQWLCFVGNSKKWKQGDLAMPLSVDGRSFTLNARRVEKVGNASIIEFQWDCPQVSLGRIIESAGEIPIPPYLNRNTEDSDKADYQTVYSRIEGSVAAPTAGLHFTDRVISEISAKGIPMRELTLHVGAGTFQPVKEDDVSKHLMHSEFISVPLSLIEELAAYDRHVYAVGTTSVRTLESLYHIGCLISQGQWDGEVPQWYPYGEGHPRLSKEEALGALASYLRSRGLESLVASTRIIIAPGYDYKIVSGMITNFHQPKSTLLLLVSAFIGDAWRQAYDYALAHDFRFLSYGDACLFEKKRP
ncbi:MAG: S-adenosylmethionine:tRNA ribosyltransferase-isomerase [Clostridium sp.]|nr:S-adenosylmethionine:tRNA ribosyltransferase-isomerase [Clostridium sp.]